MDGQLARIAASQGGVFLRRQALECGYAQDEVDRAVRAKVWMRVRRGAYVEPVLIDGASERNRHRLRVHAVVAASQSAPVVSGVSAAVLHGLDLWGHDLRRVHLTHPGISSRIEGDVQHHDAELTEDEVVWLGAVSVTSVARTAIDVARSSPSFASGVIMLDSALRKHRTTPAELAQVAEACSRWPYARGVARMVRFADGRSASAGESRLRVTYEASGLPPCEPQLYVYTTGGELIGIVDLAVLEHKTLLEFDGRSKYGIDGQDPREQVLREKVREDDLRRVGHEVARLGWAESGDVRLVRHRVLGAFERAAGRPQPRALYRFSEVTPFGVTAIGPYLTYDQAVIRLIRQPA